MLNKEQMSLRLKNACEDLSVLYYNFIHDPDFPHEDDWNTISELKFSLEELELLLNTGNENNGKDCGE